jgi:flagellar protein FlaG
VQKAVEEANAALRHLDFHLEMSVERGRDEVVTRVVNDQTGKVVRTIPREDVLDMARSLQETGGGALLDTRG